MELSIQPLPGLASASISANQYLISVVEDAQVVQVNHGLEWIQRASEVLINWRNKLIKAENIASYANTDLRALRSGAPNSIEGQWRFQLACAEAFARCASALRYVAESNDLLSPNANLEDVLSTFLAKHQFGPAAPGNTTKDLRKEYEEQFARRLASGKTMGTVDRVLQRFIRPLAAAANFPYESSMCQREPGKTFQKLFECTQLAELLKGGEVAAGETRLVQNLIHLASAIKYGNSPLLGEPKEVSKGPVILGGATWLSPLAVIQQSREFPLSEPPSSERMFNVCVYMMLLEMYSQHVTSMHLLIIREAFAAFHHLDPVHFVLQKLRCGFCVWHLPLKASRSGRFGKGYPSSTAMLKRTGREMLQLRLLWMCR